MCIPETLTYKILEYAYNRHAYGGIYRTYDRLRNVVYFLRMRKGIQKYVDSCPLCQLSKPSRQLLYGQLHPVGESKQLLEELLMDFIMGLPMTAEGNNCLLTVTDKFSKFVRLVPGTEKDSGAGMGRPIL